MLDKYEMNRAMGIPNHPPCDVCGKINGGIMGSSRIGSDYRVCGERCCKRLEMRLNNGLAPWSKEEDTSEQLMRIRINQLRHQLKAIGVKANKTAVR